MGLFSRRREAPPPVLAAEEAGPGWIPLTGETMIEPAAEMGDESAADAWAFGITFYLEHQQDSDLTLWLYPAWDESGALVLGRRFEHRGYDGADPWIADTYGTAPDDDGLAPYPDLATAHDEAQRLITGYAQETITGEAAAEPDGTGFDWEGIPWH